MKILSNRLVTVTSYLINEDQSGFLKKRFIANNLMDLNTVVMVADEEQIPAVIMAIDFEKAYDTLEHYLDFNFLLFKKVWFWALCSVDI